MLGDKTDFGYPYILCMWTVRGICHSLVYRSEVCAGAPDSIMKNHPDVIRSDDSAPSLYLENRP